MALIPPGETVPSGQGWVAQQRVLHLSELLTSLLAGREALNPRDPPNPGISQKGVLVSGSQCGHSSGSPIELSCFFTRNKNIISTPNRNSNRGARAPPSRGG